MQVLTKNISSLRAPVIRTAGAIEPRQGGAAACLYFLVMVQAKRKNADCFASLAMTAPIHPFCNSLTPLPPSKEGVAVPRSPLPAPRFPLPALSY